jgi:peptide/nickel transport system substrate-binding protein
LKTNSGRILVGLAAVIVIAGMLAGCGSAGAQSDATAGSASTLRMALSADPSPLDPATYYEAEGLQITTSTYEGLLTYAPNSSRLIPQLATSWDISPDALTYTFHLASGVKFSDGSTFDAAAMKSSFEREIALKGGPSYMLAEVASIDAPDADTFVVKLDKPVTPFLDYMASPYGPKAVSPTAVAAHTVKGDSAAAWLGTHSAGTGPYVLSKVVTGTQYVLTTNQYFHGRKPAYSTVNFAIVPDFSTQSLELQSGELDVVLHGLSTMDYTSLAANSNLRVHNFPTLAKTQIWINPASEVFGDMKARQALKTSINNSTLTRKIYGDRGTASTQLFPNSMLPDGAVADTWKPHASALKTALVSDKGKSVVVGYYGDGSLQEMANAVQVQLQQAGVSATVREYNPAQVFALPTDPTQRPDLLIATMNPDAVNVDTWISVYMEAAAPVNFLGCSAPAADALADTARNTPDAATATSLYEKAGAVYRDSLCWIDVSDIFDTIAASKSVTNMQHQLPWLFTIDLAALKPAVK